jgi:hypothetical protein
LKTTSRGADFSWPKARTKDWPWARGEFDDEEDWNLSGVERRSGEPDVVDLQIENGLDHRRLTIPITRQDCPGGYFPNESQLTDSVFDISIRLLEFRHIRGFDEFEDGATVPLLEIYPEGRGPFDDLPPLPPGHTWNLVSPFYKEERQGDSE